MYFLDFAVMILLQLAVYLVIYDVYSRTAALLKWKAAAVPYSELGMWRPFVLYPGKSQTKDFILLFFDLERYVLIKLPIIAGILALATLADRLWPEARPSVVSCVLVLHVLIVLLELIAVRVLASRLDHLPSGTQWPDTERKKHIRRWQRVYPQEQYRTHIRVDEESSRLRHRKTTVLCVDDAVTGERVEEKIIIKEEQHHYLRHPQITLYSPEKETAST